MFFSSDSAYQEVPCKGYEGENDKGTNKEKA